LVLSCSPLFSLSPWRAPHHTRFPYTTLFRSAREAEEEHRQELERRGQTESDSAPATESEDQPVLGDALHPGTGVGQKLTQGVQAVITYGQGSARGDTCHPFLPVLPGLRGEAVWVQYRKLKSKHR